MGEFSQKYTCTRPTPNFMRMRLFEYYIKERILPEVNPKDADGNVLYDLNQIVTPGMFKLEPGSTNADNIPSSITGDGTYVFVAPMDGDVLKQYLVIAKDGKVRVTTRVRISEAWTYWYPWSKEFPPCELSGEVEAAPGNAYFGFGPYVLNVPAANNFACGDKFTVIARAGEGQILGPDGELITAKPPESSDGGGDDGDLSKANVQVITSLLPEPVNLINDGNGNYSEVDGVSLSYTEITKDDGSIVKFWTLTIAGQQYVQAEANDIPIGGTWLDPYGTLTDIQTVEGTEEETQETEEEPAPALKMMRSVSINTEESQEVESETPVLRRTLSTRSLGSTSESDVWPKQIPGTDNWYENCGVDIEVSGSHPLVDGFAGRWYQCFCYPPWGGKANASITYTENGREYTLVDMSYYQPGTNRYIHTSGYDGSFLEVYESNGKVVGESDQPMYLSHNKWGDPGENKDPVISTWNIVTDNPAAFEDPEQPMEITIASGGIRISHWPNSNDEPEPDEPVDPNAGGSGGGGSSSGGSGSGSGGNNQNPSDPQIDNPPDDPTPYEPSNDTPSEDTPYEPSNDNPPEDTPYGPPEDNPPEDDTPYDTNPEIPTQEGGSGGSSSSEENETNTDGDNGSEEEESDEDIPGITFYEFEVMNDDDPSNPDSNYWNLFTYEVLNTDSSLIH